MKLTPLVIINKITNKKLCQPSSCPPQPNVSDIENGELIIMLFGLGLFRSIEVFQWAILIRILVNFSIHKKHTHTQRKSIHKYLMCVYFHDYYFVVLLFRWQVRAIVSFFKSKKKKVNTLSMHTSSVHTCICINIIENIQLIAPAKAQKIIKFRSFLGTLRGQTVYQMSKVFNFPICLDQFWFYCLKGRKGFLMMG